jgi:hypothetical protein
MHIRRWLLTPLVVGAVVAGSVSSAPVSAQQPPNKQQQQAPKPVKLEKVQELELRAAFAAIAAIKAGQPGPSGYAMKFQSDSMKGFNRKTYVAFTVFIDPTGVAAKPVTGYLRVAAKPAAPAVPPAADPAADPKAAQKPAEKPDPKKVAPEPPFAWQDFFSIPLKASEENQPIRLSRSFTVAPGEYDVFLVLRETSDPKAKEKDVAAAKAGILRQTVVVPDYWTSELATSSIIVTDTVTNLTAPLTPEEQSSHPYAFGQAELRPMLEPKLSKKAELTAWFFVYNPAADANRKPNIYIEYKFYLKVAGAEGGEKYFNATKPVELNAETLPPQFDMAAGHQLPGGLAVPLASFPEGVYRLEVKIMDKISGKSLVTNVAFSVTP